MYQIYTITICLIILCNHLTQENYSDIFLLFSLNPDNCSLVAGIKEETPNSHKNSNYYSRSLKL